jgi:hypothetical protein
LLRRLAASLFALTNIASAQAPPTFEAIPVAVTVPTAPVVFVGDGISHLCYEIYLTNMTKDAWTLERVEADDGAGASLTKLEGAPLEAALRHPGSSDLKGDALFKLAAGERMIAFIWIDLTRPAPKQLHHTLTWHKGDEHKSREMRGGVTPVLTGMSAISSPLRGKLWVAANGPSNTSAHRRALLVIDGVPHISQRYAIDWVQIDNKGSTHHGDEKNNANYYCHGQDALAIADATVVEVKDGIPENVPNQKPVVEITLETVAGNHVNLDLGGGIYAMYAHLIPGSIKVKVGDHVTRGQFLGLVGNTGNSTEPHLHFQLMNANSPLGSEGLPYTMDFTLTGRGNDDKPGVYPLPSPEPRHAQIPLENEVVDF